MINRTNRAVLLVALAACAGAWQPQRATAGSHRSLARVGARGKFLDELERVEQDDGSAAPPAAAAEAEAAAAAAMPAAERAVAPAAARPSKADVTLAPEITFWEGPPSWTEMIVPGISVLTVIGIVPFAASVSRQAWVRYKVATRRISVQSGLGGNDETEIVYSAITGARFVFRMGGSVGDMVLTLRDGAKLEMRHVPEFNKIYKFISEKVDEQCRATMQEMTGMADMDPLPETLMTASG